MDRPIIVPVDGSPAAECALPYALSLARRSGAAVELVAVERPLPLTQRHLILEPIRWARPYLAEVRDRLVQVGFQDLVTTALAGEVVGALDTRVREVDAQMVVMATHGKGAMSRFWLGSVTDGFVRRTDRPVLLVRPREATRGPSLDTEPPMRRILVTLDGSVHSESALEPALRLADLTDGRLRVLRVVQYPPETAPRFLAGTRYDDPGLLAELRQRAEGEMSDVVGRLRERGVEVTGVVEVAEQPADAILAWCAQHDVDLVAMATHGRSPLGRFVMGSVTDKIVRGGSLPVLLVRPGEEA